MNKQEAIEKIKKLKGLTIKEKNLILDIEMISKGDVLEIIEQIDEPEKPVVPQFVADWYENNKYNIENSIYRLCAGFYSKTLDKEIYDWFGDPEINSIETLVKMKLFGYEVEKEKLYKVSLKKNGIGIGIQQQDGYIKDKLTKTELSECGFDDLDVYEVREAEE